MFPYFGVNYKRETRPLVCPCSCNYRNYCRQAKVVEVMHGGRFSMPYYSEHSNISWTFASFVAIIRARKYSCCECMHFGETNKMKFTWNKCQGFKPFIQVKRHIIFGILIFIESYIFSVNIYKFVKTYILYQVDIKYLIYIFKFILILIYSSFSYIRYFMRCNKLAFNIISSQQDWNKEKYCIKYRFLLYLSILFVIKFMIDNVFMPLLFIPK